MWMWMMMKTMMLMKSRAEREPASNPAKPHSHTHTLPFAKVRVVRTVSAFPWRHRKQTHPAWMSLVHSRAQIQNILGSNPWPCQCRLLHSFSSSLEPTVLELSFWSSLNLDSSKFGTVHGASYLDLIWSGHVHRESAPNPQPLPAWSEEVFGFMSKWSPICSGD